ncbi:hypothetical protein [Rhizobium leucaenae]|uniref:hypothetical protein n=1 Tax=Rhizobium leucaenae TaxID=29450 RepID=UPI000685380E|nr:hypothetical protein [Rhizobium leucaenae]
MTKDIDHEIGQGKVCTKCGEWKLLDEYYVRNKKEPEKRHNQCKECIKAKVREYEVLNKDKLEPKKKVWRSANKEKINAVQKIWRSNNPDKVREYQYKWNRKNPDKIKASVAKHNKKRSEDPKHRVNSNISRAIRQCIDKGKKSGYRAFELLGYTVDDLIEHLERKFKEGMNWDNYGKNGWEIDHVVPLDAHNFSDPSHYDFKRAWALSNLQPLWRGENRSKKNKLSSPFQPTLALPVPANDNIKKKEAS